MRSVTTVCSFFLSTKLASCRPDEEISVASDIQSVVQMFQQLARAFLNAG